MHAECIRRIWGCLVVRGGHVVSVHGHEQNLVLLVFLHGHPMSSWHHHAPPRYLDTFQYGCRVLRRMWGCLVVRGGHVVSVYGHEQNLVLLVFLPEHPMSSWNHHAPSDPPRAL